MRSEEEIMSKAAEYQQRLEDTASLLQQARQRTLPMPELELLLLALVDKLEILFWVLEIELATPEVMEEFNRLYN